MFVTNWISTTKIQKISEITNFFRHYFLSRTEVYVYKEILRARMSKAKRKNVFAQIKRLGANRLLYSLERVVKVLSQILPFIPAPKRDYVEGVKLTR